MWSKPYKHKDQQCCMLWCRYENSIWLQKFHFTWIPVQCWGVTASYVQPKAPCPPHVPGLCRETEDSPPTTKQLSVNYVHPFCPCSQHFKGFFPDKNRGQGNDLAACPKWLGRVKALYVQCVFLGYLCVSMITGRSIWDYIRDYASTSQKSWMCPEDPPRR